MESRHLCHKNKNKSACVFVLYHLRTINAQKQPADHYCACNHFPLLKKILSELETGNLSSLNVSKAKHFTYWEESNPEEIVWIGVRKLIFSEWLNKQNILHIGKN